MRVKNRRGHFPTRLWENAPAVGDARPRLARLQAQATPGQSRAAIRDLGDAFGPPPRARGKASKRRSPARTWIPNPARAGKRENSPFKACFKRGPPPRARGKDPDCLPFPNVRKCTPPRARERPCKHVFTGRVSPHPPRARGKDAAIGTHPPARGEGQRFPPSHLFMWGRPARAGHFLVESLWETQREIILPPPVK